MNFSNDIVSGVLSQIIGSSDHNVDLIGPHLIENAPEVEKGCNSFSINLRPTSGVVDYKKLFIFENITFHNATFNLSEKVLLADRGGISTIHILAQPSTRTFYFNIQIVHKSATASSKKLTVMSRCINAALDAPYATKNVPLLVSTTSEKTHSQIGMIIVEANQACFVSIETELTSGPATNIISGVVHVLLK